MNERPSMIDRLLRKSLPLEAGTPIHWLSPLADDDYAEYSDKTFLDRLEVELADRALSDFWPSRGPVWDGLARCGSDVILVEAKAHVAEMASPGTAASALKIRKSLQEAKGHLRSKAAHDWSGVFYQYTNRLAHLYLLRVLNGVPAHLVFLYFLNAEDVSGPRRRAEWDGAIELIESVLGVKHHRLSRYVTDIFVDAASLRPEKRRPRRERD